VIGLHFHRSGLNFINDLILKIEYPYSPSYTAGLPGPCFSKVPRTLRARKAIRKSTTCLFCKAGLSYVVKGIKTKITAKFRASRRLRFEDTKRIMSPEIRPKSFGTFEKQASGPVARSMVSAKHCLRSIESNTKLRFYDS